MSENELAPPSGDLDTSKSYTATFSTERGEFEIMLFANDAPLTVENFVNLARADFYNATTFHRVIPRFMVQGGDPTGTGTSGSGQKQKAEFSTETHLRGAVSMARSSDPNSADSQFFIVLGDAPWLDRKYTLWGRVIEGMEFVDNIKKGDPNSGAVDNPDKIVTLRVAADVDE